MPYRKPWILTDGYQRDPIIIIIIIIIIMNLYSAYYRKKNIGLGATVKIKNKKLL